MCYAIFSLVVVFISFFGCYFCVLSLKVHLDKPSLSCSLSFIFKFLSLNSCESRSVALEIVAFILAFLYLSVL